MTKYKINPKIAYRKIKDEIFVVDTENSYLHKLNETASFIWECIKKEMSDEEIIENLIREFDVEYFEAEKDLKEFLKTLKEKNLIL